MNNACIEICKTSLDKRRIITESWMKLKRENTLKKMEVNAIFCSTDSRKRSLYRAKKNKKIIMSQRGCE